MFSKITDNLVDNCISEFKKDDTQEKLKTHILDPIICYILDKLYPYILCTSIIFILTFIIATIILFLLIKGTKN
jgi:membrane-bound ClpP family serine protease